MCSHDYISSATLQCETVAGSTVGFWDGIGSQAQFCCPEDVCVDNRGNIFVADTDNSKIRRINQSGFVSTIAGTSEGFSDGGWDNSKFRAPGGVCVDEIGNVYVSDTDNHKIRKISPEGLVTTIAGKNRGYQDGVGTEAKFNGPAGLCVDKDGNIYVADLKNDKIRKVSTSGIVSTVAGTSRGFMDGAISVAQFNGPVSICIDQHNTLYVADLNNHKIRMISPNGFVSTLAGSIPGYLDGNGEIAQFNGPAGICIDTHRNCFIAELHNDRIRKVTPNGHVMTIAGSIEGFQDGRADLAQFNGPVGISIDNEGNIFVADKVNHKIRRISGSSVRNLPHPSEHTFADLVCVLGKEQERFYLHKAVISLRCPLFGDHIKLDHDGEMVLPFSPLVFRQFVLFLYTNTLIEMPKFSNKDVIELLEISHRYQVKELIKICQNDIILKLDQTNVFEFITLIYPFTSFVSQVWLMNEEFNWVISYFVQLKIQPPNGFLSTLSEQCKDMIMLSLLSPALPFPRIELLKFSPIKDTLTTLWKSKVYSDFVIIVGDKHIKVHKFILSRWPFFTSVLLKSGSTKSVTHETSMPSETFEKLIGYLYCGFNDVLSIRDCGWIASLSGYYLIDEPSLLFYCQKRLDSINEENWPEALQLAVELEDEELQMEAHKIAKESQFFNFLKTQFEIQFMQAKENRKKEKIIRIQRQTIEEQNAELLASNHKVKEPKSVHIEDILEVKPNVEILKHLKKKPPVEHHSSTEKRTTFCIETDSRTDSFDPQSPKEEEKKDEKRRKSPRKSKTKVQNSDSIQGNRSSSNEKFHEKQQKVLEGIKTHRSSASSDVPNNGKPSPKRKLGRESSSISSKHPSPHLWASS